MSGQPRQRACRWCGRRLSGTLAGRIRKGDVESAHCASSTCTWGAVCQAEVLAARQEDTR